MHLPLFLTLNFIFIVTVAGHGFVHDVLIDGQDYAGWNPFVDPYASPIPNRIVRKIPNDGPIVNVDDPDIACNQGGGVGTSLIAPASAGSPVLFEWDYWPADHLGPVSTYMASCNENCATFNTTSAMWFKLDATGYDNGQWGSAKLMADNFSWTSTIPEMLMPGQYLLRHEIVALHSIGKPQFYPSCSQVNVSGTGTGQPDNQSLVLIPGVYDDVQWPDIYTDFGTFVIPGPPVVTLVSSGESTPTPPTSATISQTPTPTPTYSIPSDNGTSAPTFSTSTTLSQTPASTPTSYSIPSDNGTSTPTLPTTTLQTPAPTPTSYSMPSANGTSRASASQPSGSCYHSSARRLSRRRLPIRRSFQNDSQQLWPI